MSLIEARGLNFSYRLKHETVHAVNNADISLSKAEMICIYGASGSGKSTLLNLLAGILPAESGSLTVLGHQLVGASPAERAALRLEHVGVVFQDFNLIEEYTAIENVMLPLVALGANLVEAERQAEAALDSVGLGDYHARVPAELSGGQAQRVGIARAIAGRHKIVLCDEPTGALDSKTSLALAQELRKLVDDHGYGVVVATHDPLIREYASKTCLIQDGHLTAGG